VKEQEGMAKHRVLHGAEGIQVRFFCDLSGAAVCTIPMTGQGSREEEIRRIWQISGKNRFNYCKRCGKWVSDSMFNPDVCCCVDCIPWEEEPNYCLRCGERIEEGDRYCRHCGERLRYGEVWI